VREVAKNQILQRVAEAEKRHEELKICEMDPQASS